MNPFRDKLWRRAPLVTALAALFACAFVAVGLRTSPVAASQPTLTYISIREGDVFLEPVSFIQLCFAEPIDVTDLGLGGDFAFQLVSPSIPLGLQTVFQRDGYGVAIYPGLAPGDTSGEWTFTYRVTSPDTHEALEGTVKYRVDPSGEPVPKASPLPCLKGGGTQTPRPAVTVAPTARPSGTPSVPAASLSPTPSLPPSDTNDSDGSGPDILLLALLTVGAAAGAGLIAVVGYAIRRRVGHEPHPPHDDQQPPH